MTRLISTILALTMLLCINFPSICSQVPVSDSNSTIRRTVSSSGQGNIKLPADQATIVFQIVTTARPQEAFAKNEQVSAQVLTSVRSINGVNDSDIQILNINLAPHQDYVKNSTFEGYVQNGYDAIRTVQITVNDVTLVPSIVATIINNGANRLSSVSYGLQTSTQTTAELTTLNLATTNARQRALSIVNALPGLTLGMAISASEGSVIVPQPVFLSQNTMKLAATPSVSTGTPEAFAPGLIEVSSTVTTLFEMVPTAMMV